MPIDLGKFQFNLGLTTPVFSFQNPFFFSSPHSPIAPKFWKPAQDQAGDPTIPTAVSLRGWGLQRSRLRSSRDGTGLAPLFHGHLAVCDRRNFGRNLRVASKLRPWLRPSCVVAPGHLPYEQKPSTRTSSEPLISRRLVRRVLSALLRQRVGGVRLIQKRTLLRRHR